MSRVIAGVFVVGLALLTVGLFTGTSQWGVALVVIGALLLAVFYVAVALRATRTKGFSRAVNPGARGARQPASAKPASVRLVGQRTSRRLRPAGAAGRIVITCRH